MAFHDILLSTAYGAHFIGGLVPVNDIVRSKGGREQRNQVRSEPYVEYELQFESFTLADWKGLRNFWLARGGDLHSFRHDDVDDDSVTDENFGTGDGATATFQLKRSFADAAGSQVVTITKPAPVSMGGTGVAIKVAGVLKTEGVHYNVNYLTGQPTFTAGNIPTAGQALTWTGKHHWCVRFDLKKPQFERQNAKVRLWDVRLIGVDE